MAMESGRFLKKEIKQQNTLSAPELRINANG